MPSLTWIGKDAVLNHHLDVPYRVLEKKYTFSPDDSLSCHSDSLSCHSERSEESQNKIIHGDNLEALKSLLPEYEGRVKCIYIDPPYNTGNENWVYNDNVNSPKIKKWLGQVVGKESEDLTRHDKWLCMMYPRLKLLQKLLSKDGAIFISIDDNEQANLKLVCDEIFGAGNFVGIFSWVRKKKGSFLSKTLRKMIEYVYCYKKTDYDLTFYGENAYSDKWQPIVKRTNALKNLHIPKNLVETKLDDGEYDAGFRGTEGTGINFLEAFTVKNGIVVSDLEVDGRFVWSQDFFEKEIENGTRISLSNKYGFNVLRYDQSSKTKTPSTLINEENGVGTNEDASQDLQKIFNTDVNEVFQYSKPYSLIQYIINMLCKDDKSSIILDSFAGSGTTAHAVLNLNKQDGGNRKFILVEMEDYAETITAERVRRVIKGYGPSTGSGTVTEGTGGSFAYYELGPELLKDGFINEDVPEQTIREYLYYTETNHALPQSNNGHPAHLGNFEGVAYYFLYNKDETTTLDATFLASISEKADRYVIYADNCIMPQKFLFDHDITFKKIPRDIRRF